MAASVSWFYQDGGMGRCAAPVDGHVSRKYVTLCFKVPFTGLDTSSAAEFRYSFQSYPKKSPLLPCIKCEKKDREPDHVEISVERYPYHSYMDSTSGELEPASGARSSIPGEGYWPEGTASRVRADRAPEPTGLSTGKPSFGKKPGSRRKKYKPAAEAFETSEVNVLTNSQTETESAGYSSDEPRDEISDYVVYQTAPEQELTGYELDKKVGRPHPFVDPKAKKPIDPPLSNEELWWNWRKPEKEQWSRWQKKRPDVETVFLKAMAETGQIKLYGDEPTQTECALYRARRHIFKEERLQAEHEKLERVGPLAYYSEWVKAWKRDTSREAVQKHFEETGEDENTQLMQMFMYQTEKEYRIMMGTDVRIQRDPLAMRMREDQIKQIWGGDPVYPTINYIQDPNAVIDFRGPDFHEPTPNMLDYLKERGKIVSREEMDKILASEKTVDLEIADMDDAMARAVDIGENEDEGDVSDAETEEEDEKITRNWSVVKSNPELLGKSKQNKPQKDALSLEEALEDSENLTDFLLDFDQEED